MLMLRWVFMAFYIVLVWIGGFLGGFSFTDNSSSRIPMLVGGTIIFSMAIYCLIVSEYILWSSKNK